MQNIAVQDDEMELMTLRPSIAAKLRAAEAAPDRDHWRHFLLRVACETVGQAVKDAQGRGAAELDLHGIDPSEAAGWMQATGAHWVEVLAPPKQPVTAGAVMARVDTWYHKARRAAEIGG